MIPKSVSHTGNNATSEVCRAILRQRRMVSRQGHLQIIDLKRHIRFWLSDDAIYMELIYSVLWKHAHNHMFSFVHTDNIWTDGPHVLYMDRTNAGFPQIRPGIKVDPLFGRQFIRITIRGSSKELKPSDFSLRHWLLWQVSEASSKHLSLLSKREQ